MIQYVNDGDRAPGYSAIEVMMRGRMCCRHCVLRQTREAIVACEFVSQVPDVLLPMCVWFDSVWHTWYGNDWLDVSDARLGHQRLVESIDNWQPRGSRKARPYAVSGAEVRRRRMKKREYRRAVVWSGRLLEEFKGKALEVVTLVEEGWTALMGGYEDICETERADMDRFFEGLDW